MDSIAWTIITGMFGGIVVLMILLYRHLKSELDQVIKNQGAFSEVAQEFMAFRAMDEEREKNWSLWRSDYERRIGEYMNGQALWRHQELGPSLKRIEADLNTIKETVRHLEARPQ